jgi:hypothetical protein
MEWITIVDWPGGTVAGFDEAHAEHGDPDGLIARYVGTFDGDMRIIAVWADKQAAERFFADMSDDVARRLAPRTNGTPAVAAFSAERSWSVTPVA